MGEFKQSLAAEAAQDALASTAPQVALAAPAAPAAPIVQPAPAVEPTPATPTAPLLTPASPNAAQLATKADQMQVTLKPSEAAEIKLDMRKGATVNYTWSTQGGRSEEHTSELTTLMRISSAVFSLNKKTET